MAQDGQSRRIVANRGAPRLARSLRMRAPMPIRLARRPPPGIVYERTVGAAQTPLAKPYARRQPEKSLLYKVVARDLATFERAVEDESDYGRGLPAYIEKDLHGYLDCGILAKGFARIQCEHCKTERLVAYSCKSRGVCPSCTTRRMHDTAAHLVDRVLPHLPMRQWVLTFSPRVRFHLAEDPRLAAEALTLFVRALFTWQRRCARRQGHTLGRANSTGAITFIQRFNSALQLSLHFHTLAPDGVFVRDDPDPETRPRFVGIDPPTDEEVAQLLDVIIKRVTAMLRKKGRLDQSDPDPSDTRRATLEKAARSPLAQPSEPDELPALCARKEGFSLHAATAIHPNDRVGLERLCRYGARPALSQERLSETSDGNLQYKMKRTFSNGTQSIRLTPHELLTRLCALVPPPRLHQVRYHGLFAPRARGRAALTGRASRPRTKPDPTTADAVASPASSSALAPHAVPTPLAAGPFEGAPPPHPDRPIRLPWADLLRRVHAIEVFVCADCTGPMRVIAFITDLVITEKILRHLGLPSTPPPRGPPRRGPPRRAPPPRAPDRESHLDDAIDPPAPDDD